MAGQSVVFNDFLFNERGTTTALFQYAQYNEKILNNTSVILVPKTADGFAVELFKNNFQNVVFYDSQEELYSNCKNADLFYTHVSGLKTSNEIDSIPCKTAVHCTFTAHDPHGNVYAAVSDWVAENYALQPVPTVPLITELPDVDGDLRQELGIPETAVVFGRYGGHDTFNILVMMQTVAQAVHQKEDIYFIFLNTAEFIKHERVIFLPKTFDIDRKVKFINTCDAMIHARREGETFGLSVAEFSLKEKPIISWFWSHDRHHINCLGSHGLFYRSPRELFSTLTQFQKGTKAKDCYSERFNPENVMKTFESVFLSN